MVIDELSLLPKLTLLRSSQLQNSQDYRENMYVAVLYPTAFHGIAFSSGELLDLIQNVDIIIQGAAFEKAVDQYTRRIKVRRSGGAATRSCGAGRRLKPA